MYFEGIFIEPNKFYINIYNNKLFKKFTEISLNIFVYYQKLIYIHIKFNYFSIKIYIKIKKYY